MLVRLSGIATGSPSVPSAIKDCAVGIGAAIALGKNTSTLSDQPRKLLESHMLVAFRFSMAHLLQTLLGYEERLFRMIPFAVSVGPDGFMRTLILCRNSVIAERVSARSS